MVALAITPITVKVTVLFTLKIAVTFPFTILWKSRTSAHSRGLGRIQVSFAYSVTWSEWRRKFCRRAEKET